MKKKTIISLFLLSFFICSNTVNNKKTLKQPLFCSLIEVLDENRERDMFINPYFSENLYNNYFKDKVFTLSLEEELETNFEFNLIFSYYHKPFINLLVYETSIVFIDNGFYKTNFDHQDEIRDYFIKYGSTTNTFTDLDYRYE